MSWFAALQYVLPKHALSRVIYAVARSESPWVQEYVPADLPARLHAEHGGSRAAGSVRVSQLQRFLHARAARGCAADRCRQRCDRQPRRRHGQSVRPARRQSAAAGEGPSLFAAGSARGRCRGRRDLSRRQLRVHLSRAVQLSPHSHAVCRHCARESLRARRPVQRECGDGSRRAARLRAQRAPDLRFLDAARTHGRDSGRRAVRRQHRDGPLRRSESAAARAQDRGANCNGRRATIRQGRGAGPLQHGIDGRAAVRAQSHRLGPRAGRRVQSAAGPRDRPGGDR